jgi:crotonobetainyl-CoA:carnitine CoA-transferase CaiB-like acyl-CoA transferase
VSQALAGVHVVDFSNGFAGALVSQLLADYGADVVHVEPPEGSALRGQPGFYFWERGKRSAVLDLRQPADRARARGLAHRADVLVEAFRPGVMDRLGLGDAALRPDNPRLIYTSITGFGSSGPYRDAPGYEGLVMARIGGMRHFRAAPRPGPSFCSVPYCSFSAAQTALQGTLAALYARERTGLGQRVETSLVQGMAAHDPWDWFLHLIAERYPDAFKNPPSHSPRGVPNQSFGFRLLVCLSKDGRWLQFSQTSPHLFKAFMRALELDWMFGDPEWSSAPEFPTEEKRERFWEKMLEAARRKTVAEWNAVFEREPDVWAEIYRGARELFDHPQMRHNGHVLELDDPRVGKTLQLAPMVRMSGTPGRVRAPAPELGAHSAEVFASFGAAAKPAAPRARPADARPPLEGVTVLDLGLFYAAPYGPAVLADYGARVIKLEPLTGEPMRMLLGFPDAGAVKSLQGKESLAIDAHRPEGREIAQRIARKVDLVLMSYRAGVAEKMGLDYASLRALNPNVVYLSSPGYGIDGPCGRKPAFAPTIGAGSGLGWFNAAGSVPQGPDLMLDEIKWSSIRLGMCAQAPGNADGCSSLGVATALLLGLVARQRTGQGQEMLTSMLCTTAYALSEECIEYAGRPERRTDPQMYGRGALYRLYEAAEGWVFLAAPHAREWERLVRAEAGFAPLAGDARFASASARAANDPALAEALGRIFRTRSAADWERALLARGVGCVEVADGPIYRAVMDDPIARDAGFLTEVEHPSFGLHRRLGPLAALSLTPAVARPACLLGQHTESLLLEFGYSPQEIERLEADGVIARQRG